jgi:hypothetical protein
LSVTIVSVMLTGAGSVDVSARAILATTSATSGTAAIATFCFLAISTACVKPMAGSVTGMNNRCPSFNGGMNSLPIRGIIATAPANTRTAAAMVSTR